MLGVISIYFKSNNIFFILSCATTGSVLKTFSCSNLGFSKLKREALQIIQEAGYRVKQERFKIFILKLRGYNRFRSLVLKEFLKFRLNIVKIVDLNIIPFNGCKPNKQRRI